MQIELTILPISLIANENPCEQQIKRKDALQELCTIFTNFLIYLSLKLYIFIGSNPPILELKNV